MSHVPISAGEESGISRYWPAVLGALVVLGVVMVVLALNLAPQNAPTTWTEVGKAGLQLIVAGVAVTLISGLVRRVDQEHQEQREKSDYMTGQLLAVIGLYNDVKSVRRRLRAGGFQSASPAPFSATQDATFDALMNELNRAELALETVRRGMADRSVLSNADLETLKAVDTYISGVMDLWEVRKAPKPSPTQKDPDEAWANLQRFLGDAQAKGGFKPNVADPMREIESAIRSRALLVSRSGRRL